MIYAQLPPEEALSQGDILDDCPVAGHVSVPGPDGYGADIWRERVIVMTQACDLAQGRTSKVVVALVKPAALLVEQGVLRAGMVRDQLRRGQVYGWYFLPSASSPVVFPESIIDLRDLHTVPRSILDELASAGKRLCRLATPFREHLAQHFAVTYMRIGLPAPYETD